jgi:hypothetical protein
VYEIVRTIYSTPTADGSESSRVAVLQQTLSQLRLTNIATLDACMNHFTRLIDLTSADETYVSSLATALAPCVLRPRTETSLTLEEKHAYKLVRDLFSHKEAIFTALKRMSTLNHSSSVTAARQRAISTDESNRKALMEERNRALLEKAKATASRSRATSPAPGARGHRRDRSSGGPETRFPIQTSPTTATSRQAGSINNLVKRTSLEVPGPDGEAINGNSAGAGAGAGTGTDSPSKLTESINAADFSSDNKRDSWSGTKFVGGKRVPATPSSPPQDSPSIRGVTLEDRAIED